VAWDPNPEANIQGYRIYHGKSAGGPTNVVDVGTQTTGTVTNLNHSTAYFFFVTAYNTFGLESDPSDTLTYQTPGPLSLSMDGLMIVLAPSVITLRPRVSGYRPPGTELLVSWRETSSSGVAIQGADTLTPQIAITAPGSYGFEVTMTAGATRFITATSVMAIDGTGEPNRSDQLVLSYFPVPLDEVVYFYWNGHTDRTYALAYTRHLGDRTWVPITLFHQGYSDHTVSEAWLASLGSVFFSVFEQP